MLKKFVVSILFSLASLQSYASEFAAEIALQTLTVIDWAQTRYIVKNPDRFYETNPILGQHPSMCKVNTFMIARILCQHYCVKILPENWREPVLWGLTIDATYTVTQNAKIGLSFSKGF